MASALAGISLLDNPSDDPAKRRQQMEARKAAQNLRASGIRQYVAYQAKEFEQLVKNGFCKDSGMHFEEYAHR